MKPKVKKVFFLLECFPGILPVCWPAGKYIQQRRSYPVILVKVKILWILQQDCAQCHQILICVHIPYESCKERHLSRSSLVTVLK